MIQKTRFRLEATMEYFFTGLLVAAALGGAWVSCYVAYKIYEGRC
jgi:MFS-type transporter involved in bile tolerance (Atg22 family)